MIKIDDTDITGYVTGGGITETTEKVYDNTLTDSEAVKPCKGVFCKYALSLEAVPQSVKSALASCAAAGNAVNCIIGETSVTADIDGYSADIQLETEDIRLWKINLTLTDTVLSKEAENEHSN